MRDYQERAVEAVLKEWEESTSTLISHPTGCGKTTIFTEIVRRCQPKRALILAHREELIFQIQDRMKEQAGLYCDIEMAEMNDASTQYHGAPVVVATVQTLISGRGDKRRMHRFSPDEFGILTIDECHHSTAASYRSIIDHFKRNPDLRILGVTATPDRADEEALGQVFDTVADDYEILDAIHDGWLVPIDQQMVQVEGLDYTNVRTTAGDLNSRDLAIIMEAEKNLQGICGSTIEIIEGKQTIVFTASVKHAELACNIFNRHKHGIANWVSAKTPKDERRDLMRSFRDGSLQVICNVGVITEGVDVPGAAVCVMARPTKSRSLYAQMAGRVLRPLPGIVDDETNAEQRQAIIESSAKPCALVIDFVGNSGRHRLVTSADILGGKESDEVIELAIRNAQAAGRPVRMDEEIADAREQIRLRKEKAKLDYERKVGLIPNVRYNKKYVDPFSAFDIQPARERGWDLGRSLSDKQKALLMRQGIDTKVLSYAQGRQLLNNLFHRWKNKLATLKQCSLLKRFGYETKNLTMKEASVLIDGLAKNGWRRAA